MNEYMEKYLSIHSFSFSGQCLVERRKSKIILCASIPVKDRSVYPSWYEQGVRVRGGYSRFQVTGMIEGFFWVGKRWLDSAHVSRPPCSAIKVQPN